MSKKREKIEAEFINAWSKLFDLYPELNCVPVYAWGRYYKYESSGRPFTCEIDGEGIDETFIFGCSVEDPRIDEKLLERIDEEHEELIDEGIGDYSPSRRDIVYSFGGDDDRGGHCMLLVRKPEGIAVEIVRCDSPE